MKKLHIIEMTLLLNFDSSKRIGKNANIARLPIELIENKCNKAMSNQTQNRNYTSKTDILDQNYQHDPPDQKKDKDRREGKGRHSCLGGSIDSIPCCASYFAPGKFEEQDELHQEDMKKRMNQIILE